MIVLNSILTISYADIGRLVKLQTIFNPDFLEENKVNVI
jgi:hypothetical protein